jgi:trehalose utilization protein
MAFAARVTAATFSAGLNGFVKLQLQARDVQLHWTAQQAGEIADEISLRMFSLYGAGCQDLLA